MTTIQKWFKKPKRVQPNEQSLLDTRIAAMEMQGDPNFLNFDILTNYSHLMTFS